ncbi:MAG: hypothetical protein R2747_06030 [Pyrinomonadaceae bacterium]
METILEKAVRTETTGKNNICLNCMSPNDPNEVFCRTCNDSLSLTSNTDPVQGLHGEGVAYRKAVEGKPKPVVLIGVWLLFAPVLVFSVWTAISTVFTFGGSEGFVIFWISLISAVFSFTMVFRVTKNYWKFREVETDI